MNTRMLLIRNNNNRVRNLDFLFGDNNILQGTRRSYNLNIMNVPAMFVEGCHVLISPATNRTPYSNIQMFPDTIKMESKLECVKWHNGTGNLYLHLVYSNILGMPQLELLVQAQLQLEKMQKN